MKPLKRRLEALFFTRDRPLDEALLTAALGVEESELQTALAELQRDYHQHSALELVAVASGWRLQLRPEYEAEIQALAAVAPPRYSRAFWETLAFIAYHQPVTRSDIDAARGVQTSSAIYQQLFSLEWVAVVGRKKALGSPELLAVTPRFLDDFNLSSPADLPSLDRLETGAFSP